MNVFNRFSRPELRRAGRRTRPALRFEALEDRTLMDGALDASFGLGGKSTIAFDLGGDNTDRANAVVVQPDGKIVLVGSVERDSSYDFDFAVVRLNSDGSLDTSFDGDGKQTIAFNIGGDNNDVATSVAIDPDGKIVVAGIVHKSSTGDSDFGVARLNTDGSLDSTFSADGKRTIAFDHGGENFDAAQSVAIDSLGRIVVVGSAQRDDSFHDDFVIARLSHDGSLDATFNGDGTKTVAFDLGGEDSASAFGVAIDAIGRIVAVGGGAGDFAVVRLNDDGSFDSSFDGDGRRTIAFDLAGSNNDRASSVAIQPDGKIVVAGSVQTGTQGTYGFGVARLNSDGSLDLFFDSDGKQAVAFESAASSDDSCEDAAVDSLGRVVLAGYSYSSISGHYVAAVARFEADGTFDTSFDGDGKQTTVFDQDGTDFYAKGMAIQPDGRVVVAGTVDGNTFGSGDLAVARLTGSLPISSPAVTLPGRVTTLEGQASKATGTYTNPAAGAVSATVDYGDGGGALPLTLNPDMSFALDHVYETSGSYVATVKVSDGNGHGGMTSLAVTVVNVAPSVAAPVSLSNPEGQASYSTGSFTDPGAGTWSGTVDYGDGTGTQPLALGADKTFTLNHVYGTSGTYAATVKITDSKGAAGTATIPVRVNNLPPIARIASAPSAFPKKGSVTFQGSGFDPGPASRLHYQWTITLPVKSTKKRPRPPKVVKTGTGTSILFSTKTKGVYTVTLVVTDQSGATGVASRTIRRR